MSGAGASASTTNRQANSIARPVKTGLRKRGSRVSSWLKSVIRFAGLVERLAADPVEAQLRRPGQHQRAAPRIAVQALERQVLQHRLPAASADREPAQLVRVFHD